jgi:hypothetical protein
MVARFDSGYPFADGFNDTSTLMSEDDWESTFRVFSAEGVGIYSGTPSVAIVCDYDRAFQEMMTHPYDRLQCSRFQCGPRGLLEVRLRYPR